MCRVKSVVPPSKGWLAQGKKAFVCNTTRCIPSATLCDVLEALGVTRVNVCSYGEASMLPLCLPWQQGACPWRILDCVRTLRHCAAGSGIRADNAALYPFLTLQYGLRASIDPDDGLGETRILVDYSDTYRFPGLWSVAGWVSERLPST